MQSHLRIVSALYGLLKPCDAIQKYRMCFDYKVHCLYCIYTPCGKTCPILTASSPLTPIVPYAGIRLLRPLGRCAGPGSTI